MNNDGEKVSSGIEGLDHVLHGGLIPRRSYLVRGGPGVGKSTVGSHFLEEGNRRGEDTLLITLSEKQDQILENAARLDIDLAGTRILDLSPESDLYRKEKVYSVFAPADVEQESISKRVAEVVEELQPSRVVLDSITMLNMVNTDPYQARTLGISFIRFICGNGATLMMLSEMSEGSDDSSFWADSILQLQYDEDWRKVVVTKYRGSGFLSGSHAFRINDTGVKVFPRLQPNRYSRTYMEEQLSSGIDGLDRMLNGGLERGTTTIVTGPTGVGKTNLGTQFMKEAASRKVRSAIYTFEESEEVIIQRSEGISIPVREMIGEGNLKIESIEPLSYSPDEFTEMVRADVEKNDTRLVMIDSIGGYKLAVGNLDTLARLHSLCVYLQNMGVTTLLVNETQNIFGAPRTTELNGSYLADNIILLRYLEVEGEIRKSLGILKKRMSDFDRQIREFNITGEGIEIGKPFSNMRGILSGMPEYRNEAN